MDCRECCELLPLFVDHALSASEIAELKQHLEECAPCKHECAKLEETINLVCSLPAVEPPEDFHRRFMARFNRECKPARSWRIWGTMALSTAAAAAMVLLVVVLYNPLQQMPMPQPAATSIPEPPAEVQASAPKDQRVVTAEKKSAQPPAPAMKAKEQAEPSLSDAVAESASALAPSVAAPASRPLARRAGGLSPLITAVDFNAGGAKARADSMRAENFSAEADEAEPLIRWSGEWSGDSCEMREAQQLVIRSEDALQELWRTAGLRSLAVPEVDWRREMIGAIFLGEKPTGGYEIQLRELQRPADALVVKYAVQTPQGPAAAQLTQPFLIFRLPAANAPVRFVQE